MNICTIRSVVVDDNKEASSIEKEACWAARHAAIERLTQSKFKHQLLLPLLPV